MSESTFRGVLASVLVGFLVLAVLALLGVVPRQVEPPRESSAAITPTPDHTPTLAPTRKPIPAFAAVKVVGVGVVPRGTTSTRTIELRLVESSVDAIPNAAGSFQVTLADRAGDGSTVAFVGTPSVDAPGSLGITATFLRPNVLLVSIEGSDVLNVEPITISGLGIEASPTAQAGAIEATFGEFSGSLVLGLTGQATMSIGSVGSG